MRWRGPFWIVVGIGAFLLTSVLSYIENYQTRLDRQLELGEVAVDGRPVPRHRSAARPAADPEEVSARPPITIDQALDELKSATVAFNTPQMARVGRQVVMEAKLSTRLSTTEVKVLIDEPGKVEVGTLKVSDRMFATLSGGSAFDVSPDGPQGQWISDKAPTGWTWQVTPKHVGEQILILSFDAVIAINGKEDKRTVNTFKRSVDVEVGWPETVGEWLEWVRKMGEGLSYAWGLIFVTVGGAGWAAVKRYWSRSKAKTGDHNG
jgi:hypothetical protein